MFRGKINRSNSWLLLTILERLRNGEHEAFTINTLFNSEVVLHESCVKLELFIYRVIDYFLEVDIEQDYVLLSFMESLVISHSTSILSEICKYFYVRNSQVIVQKLPFPTTNKPNVHVIRRYHKHLHDGTKTDAVSGWLLYASFYYVLGQYNTTLKIIDHVLSRCTPNMLKLRVDNYTPKWNKYYKQNVGCSTITLNDKMRLATINNVFYSRQSTLIPRELQPEVRGDAFIVPSVVMSHCLRFLCYHHLHNIVNRQQSLRDIHLTITERYFVAENELSDSLTILGVCNEIVDDKETADRCYYSALQNEYRICPTAAKRKENLNMR
jgi:Mg2+ and Co2+ transporter CorA